MVITPLVDLEIDWKNRWLGGMCPVGAVGGLPVRAATYPSHPPLAACLRLPAGPQPPATLAEATAAWSRLTGEGPVLLLRNADRARRRLLQAARIQPGSPVGLPATADRDLTEAIKQHRARPHFIPLTDNLTLDWAATPAPSVVWDQPIGGLPASAAPAGVTLWLDYSDTLPNPRHAARTEAVVTLWGLHLTADPQRAGALLTFADTSAGHALLAALQAHCRADDAPAAAAALAQARRLAGSDAAPGLAEQQTQVLGETWRGLHDAAGLLLGRLGSAALAQYIAVQMPTETDPATFYAYVRAENTPVCWLPDVRPPHYQAVREGGAAAVAAWARLARWLLVPVGPDYSREEISHAVIGIVKAADYLGVRWRTVPARAAEYARLMTELYGPDHDAYRPVFHLDGVRPSGEWVGP